MFKKSKKDVIGLDIGSHSVKLVQLGKTKDGYRLQKFDIAPLPPEAIVDGAVMDSGSIIEVIRGLVSKNKVKCKNAVVSISGYSVIIKKVTFAYMSEEELAESIQWEAAQYIPFDIEDVNIDFQILEENPDNPDQMNVLLVAAKKDVINDYETLINESGLETVIIDVDSFALETMYENNYDIQENEVTALINIGASMMNFNILRGGISALTRDVSVGGKQVTEEIQKQYNIGYEEAEKLKLSSPEEWEKYKNFDQALRNASDLFATEIQRSLDFFYANYPDAKIDKIVLCGGGAKTFGLKETIEQRLGLSTIVANPFAKIKINEKDFDRGFLESVAPMASVGVGLAMRRVGDR